ncbi:MAG TPA: FAD-dependent oxidoreductase, partial [Stellaceae bacterium]|nr:FAD-dependent oxidoreductase [Stellaceae bacterium]
MNQALHFDLVAIGGGFAGLCAAVRGAELGLRTAVLEAGADAGYLCNSRWAGGIFHVSYHDVKLSPDDLVAAINRQTGGETDQELAAAIAADAGRTVDWLASQGAAFTQASPIGWHRFTLAPPRAAVAGQDWQGRGPDRLLGELCRRLEERQGGLLLGTRAAALRLERGRVVGVTAHKDGAALEISADSVVIADGGFPGNAELLRKYIGPRPDRVLMRHAGTAIGDGLRMAAEAGAALVGLDRFYGHLLSRDAMENEGLWPYPQIDAVAVAAIVVDRRGTRILDEGLGGIAIANDLARLDDPLCATVICDGPIWETAGKAAQIPPNPQLVAGGGALHQSDTIEALAEMAGLPSENLA